MGTPAHSLLCPTDIRHPRPIGCCDRCGFYYYLDELVWQMDYRGNSLQNLQIRVCTRTCYDVPQDQLRPIIIGPDPVPLKDPRPGFWNQQQNAGSVPPVPSSQLLGWGQGAYSLGPFGVGGPAPSDPDFIE
jgi:hypothetical protein